MRKINKIAVTTSEITVALDAADAVAATLINRIALDASDKPVIRSLDNPPTQEFSQDQANADMMGEGAPDFDTERNEEAAPVTTEVDPLAPYAEQYVKLSYLIPGYTLDVGTLYLGKDARNKAVEFANNPKIREKVGIFCATTGTKIMEVLPMVKGTRKVAATSMPRQTSTQTSKVDNRIILTEEEKSWLAAYDAAMVEDKERERARKALEAYYAKWHADYNAAVKANERFDQERAARLNKIMKANRRHPDPASKEYQDWLLLTSDEGATCPELNHNRRVLFPHDSKNNFGWRQKAEAFEVKYRMLIVEKARQCKASTKPGASMAMRVIKREEPIPAGWVFSSKQFESEYQAEQS